MRVSATTSEMPIRPPGTRTRNSSAITQMEITTSMVAAGGIAHAARTMPHPPGRRNIASAAAVRAVIGAQVTQTP